MNNNNNNNNNKNQSQRRSKLILRKKSSRYQDQEDNESLDSQNHSNSRHTSGKNSIIISQSNMIPNTNSQKSTIQRIGSRESDEFQMNASNGQGGFQLPSIFTKNTNNNLPSIEHTPTSKTQNKLNTEQSDTKSRSKHQSLADIQFSNNNMDSSYPRKQQQQRISLRKTPSGILHNADFKKKKQANNKVEDEYLVQKQQKSNNNFVEENRRNVQRNSVHRKSQLVSIQRKSLPQLPNLQQYFNVDIDLAVNFVIEKGRKFREKVEEMQLSQDFIEKNITFNKGFRIKYQGLIQKMCNEKVLNPDFRHVQKKEMYKLEKFFIQALELAVQYESITNEIDSKRIQFRKNMANKIVRIRKQMEFEQDDRNWIL